MAFPSLNHVALTVRDLGVSAPWYQELIGADPAIDEHTDAGYRHVVWAFDNGTLFGIHQHDRRSKTGASPNFTSAWTMWASAARAEPSFRAGSIGSTASK